MSLSGILGQGVFRRWFLYCTCGDSEQCGNYKVYHDVNSSTEGGVVLLSVHIPLGKDAPGGLGIPWTALIGVFFSFFSEKGRITVAEL